MKYLECEDRIDLYEYDLDELSVEHLRSLLSIILSCKGCDGCATQVAVLEKLIAKKEKS